MKLSHEELDFLNQKSINEAFYKNIIANTPKKQEMQEEKSFGFKDGCYFVQINESMQKTHSFTEFRRMLLDVIDEKTVATEAVAVNDKIAPEYATQKFFKQILSVINEYASEIRHSIYDDAMVVTLNGNINKSDMFHMMEDMQEATQGTPWRVKSFKSNTIILDRDIIMSQCPKTEFTFSVR